MIVKSKFADSPDGMDIFLYTITNKAGSRLSVTNLGGRMVELILPDKWGRRDDIIMGFDQISSYLVRNPYFGALVGRCANRIRNASFQMNGNIYCLDRNAPPHHLHGGSGGFDKRAWDAEIIREGGLDKLKLSLFSQDGDQGYPGNLWVTVCYSLTDGGELWIEYEAYGDQDTPVNLTNHCYFNLAGHSKGTVLGHILYLNADYITGVDEDNIPDGRLVHVKNTSLDFRTHRRIGERIYAADPYLQKADGYDLNYVLKRSTKKDLEKFCEVYEPESGRTMEGFTTLPAVQFYTANNIKGTFTFVGKENCRYPQHCGLCLETQYYPDSPNHPEFPSVILKKGDVYREKTMFRFGVKGKESKV